MFAKFGLLISKQTGMSCKKACFQPPTLKNGGTVYEWHSPLQVLRVSAQHSTVTSRMNKLSYCTAWLYINVTIHRTCASSPPAIKLLQGIC